MVSGSKHRALVNVVELIGSETDLWPRSVVFCDTERSN